MSRLNDLRQPSVRTYCRSCECAGPLGAHGYTTVITLLHVCPSRTFLLITGTMCFINCGHVGPLWSEQNMVVMILYCSQERKLDCS